MGPEMTRYAGVLVFHEGRVLLVRDAAYGRLVGC
jgi:hypothetical protein